MKRAACFALATMAASASAFAQDVQRSAAGVAVDAASDTDGFHAYRARAGGLYRYDNPWSYAGVAVQSSAYRQDGFRAEAPAILGVYRDQRRDTLAGVDIEAGAARISGHVRPIGDATWRLTPSSVVAVDLTASADLVETPRALERGIGHAFLATGVELKLSERLTATGLAGYQPFTDGNARTHLRGRLIWLAVPEQGVTLQLRYKQYDTRELDVEGAYFNPERYRQWLAVAAIRKRHAGWIFSGALGAGQEHATGSEQRASYLAEVRAEGPIVDDIRLVVRAGYYRAAGFIDDAGYAYRSIGASIVVPLR